MITMDERRHGPVIVLQLDGSLDSRNAPALEARLGALAAGGGAGLVLDLTGVAYVSGACLRVLLLAGKRLDGAGRRLAVCCARAEVLDILRISGLTRVIGVYPDRAGALADMGGGGDPA